MVPRIPIIIAFLLGFLSIALSHSTRPDEPGSQEMSAQGPSDVRPAPDPDRLAVVICNSDYPDARFRLMQVEQDARALTETLRDNGFLVEAVHNATRSDMTDVINRLGARTSSIKLIYFGGYGIQSDGENYLIPVDSKIWNEEDVRREGVSIDNVLSKLTIPGGRVQLAIIDASRRNPYERRFRAYSRGLAPIQTSRNTVVLSSAAPDQVVEDSDRPLSQLLTVLLAEMKRSKDIRAIFESTRDEVATATNGQQLPALSGTIPDNLSLGPQEVGESLFQWGVRPLQ